MKKKFVLKDERTGMYFTNDYNRFWDRNISRACEYDETENIGEVINSLLNIDWSDPLGGVDYLEVITIYHR